MGELELERTTLVEAIARPYVDPCYKQDPNYVVNQLRRENERLQKILAEQSVVIDIKETSTPVAVNGTQQTGGSSGDNCLSPFLNKLQSRLM